MKITYGGETPTTLADAGDPALSALVVNGQRVVQMEPLLRSATPFTAKRQNHRTLVSFVASKLHASLQAAQEFVATHGAGLTDDGTLTIVASDGTTSFTMTSCLVACESYAIGVTSITSYQFTGGKLTKVVVSP
jgi:hypothetical protein